MEWINTDEILPIQSWCKDPEDKAFNQARDLARHPVLFHHVALMPDCHTGYGMPIGGVIASKEAVIPNAVGVDIGCGMGAVRTSLRVEDFTGKAHIRELMERVKSRVPVGEGRHHREVQKWKAFEEFRDSLIVEPGWLSEGAWTLAQKNLGSLGGGNHFIELQADEEGGVWLMLHSGSRNLGYKIAEYYNQRAHSYCQNQRLDFVNKDLAYLPLDYSVSGDYIRDMTFALDYALENRFRMMDRFKESLKELFPRVEFSDEVNIHHNYASLETHFGEDVWVHRKGATSAQKDQMGIIPGSMGTSSYLVKGLGNPDSFHSCSHGAGRKMSRTAASRNFTPEECDKAMGDVVYDRWKMSRRHGKKQLDLGEAPLAYKDIDEVMNSQKDLVHPVVKLRPLGVVKG